MQKPAPGGFLRFTGGVLSALRQAFQANAASSSILGPSIHFQPGLPHPGNVIGNDMGIEQTESERKAIVDLKADAKGGIAP